MAFGSYEEPEEDRAPRALPHAGGSDSLLQTWEAADAVLAHLPRRIEVDLLVGAGARAGLLSLAAVLVAQHQTVLCPFVEGAIGAGLQTGGLAAVVAEAGEVEEMGVRILACADVLVPVHSPGRRGAHGAQEGFASLPGGVYLVVVELPGLAELLRGRKTAESQLPVLVAAPHALPVPRSAQPGLGIHRAPPHRLLALALRPQNLAGHGTGLAADAAIQVDDPRHLSAGQPRCFRHRCLSSGIQSHPITSGPGRSI